MEKERGPQNRTITLTDAERRKYKGRLVRAVDSVMLSQIINKTLCGDLLSVLGKLPKGFADLLVIDPAV
jgi:site-specific DNA-methyltransferase (adenine-specific)